MLHCVECGGRPLVVRARPSRHERSRHCRTPFVLCHCPVLIGYVTEALVRLLRTVNASASAIVVTAATANSAACWISSSAIADAHAISAGGLKASHPVGELSLATMVNWPAGQRTPTALQPLGASHGRRTGVFVPDRRS